MGRYTGDLIEVSNGPAIRHGKGTYSYSARAEEKGAGEEGSEAVTSTSFYKYDGEWRNGVKDGKGSFTLHDHSVYTGDFLDGEMTGTGRREYKDGSWYDGNWRDGEREGYGVEFLKEKEMRYEGIWRGNKREGKGKLTWGKDQSDFVEGVFSNHRIQGPGVSVTRSLVYRGAFAGGVFEGDGVARFRGGEDGATLG
ncbi:hypothetical protein TrRE_jg2221, partial [Triparma retinervis]